MSRSNVSVVRALGVGTLLLQLLSFSQQVSCRYEEHVSSTVILVSGIQLLRVPDTGTL
jgi:hypothetical protein